MFWVEKLKIQMLAEIQIAWIQISMQEVQTKIRLYLDKKSEIAK